LRKVSALGVRFQALQQFDVPDPLRTTRVPLTGLVPGHGDAVDAQDARDFGLGQTGALTEDPALRGLREGPAKAGLIEELIERVAHCSESVARHRDNGQSVSRLSG